MNLPSFIQSPWFRSLFVMAALASLIVFAVIPLQDKIVLENDEVQQAYAKMENDQKRISTLPDLRLKYQKISDDKGKMGSVLPEDQVVEYIKNLEDIASKTDGTINVTQGKDLDTIRNAAPTKGTDTTGNTATGDRVVDHLPKGKTLGLTVTFSGRYRDAVEFVHKVETAPYFADVLSLDFRPGDAPTADRSNLFVSSGLSAADVSTNPAPPSSVSVQAVISLVLYLE